MAELGVEFPRYGGDGLVAEVFEGEVNEIEVHAFQEYPVRRGLRLLKRRALIQLSEGLLLSYVRESCHYSLRSRLLSDTFLSIIAWRSSIFTRSWLIVSRSRTVTQPSSRV